MKSLLKNIKSSRIMEEQKELNLVEILKDCPKGTKLWSPICGECTLESIDDSKYPITLLFQRGESIEYCYLTEHGHYLTNTSGECMLFPSKDNRDWSTFKVEKPKWNPDTLQPFDKVLVRDDVSQYWCGNLYLYTDKETDSEYPYSCINDSVKYCIPFNDDTKHLLGTNQEAPEYYRK